jgi:hypothetical protein
MPRRVYFLLFPSTLYFPHEDSPKIPSCHRSSTSSRVLSSLARFSYPSIFHASQLDLPPFSLNFSLKVYDSNLFEYRWTTSISAMFSLISSCDTNMVRSLQRWKVMISVVKIYFKRDIILYVEYIVAVFIIHINFSIIVLTYWGKNRNRSNARAFN